MKKAAIIRAAMETLGAELIELDQVDEPTGEEIARSTAALDEYEALAADLAEAEAQEQRMELVRAAMANPANREAGAGITPGQGPYIKRSVDPYDTLAEVTRGRYAPSDVIERAKHAVDQAPRHMSDVARARVVELIGEVDEDDDEGSRQAPAIARHILMTGSRDYHKQFREYMRTGYAGELLRASLSLTDANGGYLVPFTLDPTIILTNAGIVDPIRSISTIKTIATDDWNGVTSAGVTSNWTDEGAEVADNSPTFGPKKITPKRADTWIDGTYEVLADSGFASELGRLVADAKARHEGAAFATANVGASRPRGVVAAVAAVSGSLVASATAGAFAQADVYAVADALRPRDAANATWLANKRIYNKIRQFDTAGGSAFWANLGMGRPNELLGQPAREASTMTSTIAAGALPLLAGDFSNYYIIDRVGMSVQFDPLLKGANGRPNGKAGWFAFWRVGADVVDPDAFRLLQLSNPAVPVALA
ncbi:phage major capsid protein [Micromonospora sp. RTGN7]|uniref:phage major capsid protein n=1 Tax=Micromonospora sp. RTGN7 TaxID=3016526 RepID=UPI0029FF51C9|nr:phage major capsid protein [Micromonospora sp. RTGN7]